MRIATWNIKGVRGHQRRLLDWLRARQPDLVALQKTNAQDMDFPFDAVARAGYHAEVHYPAPRRRGDRGVAILSRQKPRVLAKGLPGREEFGPRLLTVGVNGLEFSSVYAPYKRRVPAGTKIEWFESLTDHLVTTCPQSGRRLLCGDFNVVPECRFGPKGRKRTPTYDKDVQDRFRDMLNAAGLFDLYDAPPPDPGWSDLFAFEGREARLEFSRLEYVLGTQRMVDLNPDVRFDIEHAIVDGSFNRWVRAPIVADFDE